MRLNNSFNEHEVIHALKHFLPAQAPLKDFIHHNTLHAFQKQPFDVALRNASGIFGYKVTLSMQEYRDLYNGQRVNPAVLDKVIREKKGSRALAGWHDKLLHKQYGPGSAPRIGELRANWKKQYHTDLDTLVHPGLFRILCSYLDQGISIWNFPVRDQDFLSSLREMEQQSLRGFFRKKRAKQLLLGGNCSIAALLKILVGDESLYGRYLFDQQFAHPGWSGMVSAIEDQPQTLLDQRKISLHDLIVFELLLEIDALDFHLGNWQPLAEKLPEKPADLFEEVPETEQHEALMIWQEAFERSYYDQVLAGISTGRIKKKNNTAPAFQAMFCIDDRECSFRRYVEKSDVKAETFGTPGFFGVEFFFQPADGKHYTKLCPAPVTPKFLIKEGGVTNKREKDPHFTKHAHSFHTGWLISQTLGFWSALKLVANVFRPSMSPATSSSFRHMDKYSKLMVEHDHHTHENGLQVGFTVDEMTVRVEGLLKSIGLVQHFAPLVYVIGHGSSSVNNPHYAAYDCGACSGRAGSVNARVICTMANHPAVRIQLESKGIFIPAETRFVGAIHDTTRDEILFFDEDQLSPEHKLQHEKNVVTFNKALDLNAKERSRRFESIDTTLSLEAIHEKIRRRSVSLFEPRPELNHATNALCIVGRRELSKGLFLDRRSFLNSYDHTIDPDGKYLFNILKAAAPVCGGINLEYYFSRVDNQKLGAGTKLPHNVMGLFAVANGIDGDLRPGLPSQMIEVHDPVRLLMLVEHYPEVVLDVIKRNADTYEWFQNNWVHLVAVNPDTRELWQFTGGGFVAYQPQPITVSEVNDIVPLLETSPDNFPVFVLN